MNFWQYYVRRRRRSCGSLLAQKGKEQMNCQELGTPSATRQTNFMKINCVSLFLLSWQVLRTCKHGHIGLTFQAINLPLSKWSILFFSGCAKLRRRLNCILVLLLKSNKVAPFSEEKNRMANNSIALSSACIPRDHLETDHCGSKLKRKYRYDFRKARTSVNWL
jgi:hypothetical protein